MRIAIIGGGISGLTTAFYLKERIKNANISLFEKDKKLGGKIKTENIDGFLFENGSNGFLSNRIETFRYIQDLALEELLLQSENDARVRYIFDKNRLHKFPTDPKEFLSNTLLSPFGKLRVLSEILIPKKDDDSDETLEEFGKRRFGSEFTKKFLDPMSAGVFGSSAKKLSINSAFPRIIELEKQYRSLFRAMYELKRGGQPSGILVSFLGGMGNFIEHLETKLNGVNIFRNSEVKKIEREKDKLGFMVYNLTFKELDVRKDYNSSFDKVIFATESFEASKLLVHIDRELANTLAGIEYAPMSVVGFGYKNMQNSNLNAFGFLTTERSKTDILGALYDSSIFKDRAKEGDQSIRFMIGGVREPALAFESKDELIAIAKSNAKEILKIDKEPDVISLKTWAKAIPSYTLGHQKRVEKIFQKERDGIFFNSNAYFGVGFNDCIINSQKVVDRVIASKKEI